MTQARDQILETTCELLELQGYHATGLNQIIKESGSPKGSLYYYFPGGKDELTAEALKRVGRIVLERIQMSLAEIENPAEAIGGFLLKLAYFVPASGYRAGGPITTVALETAATNEMLSIVCREIYGAWQAAFAGKLVEGGFSPERARSLATLIISAIEGAIILSRTSRSPQPLEDCARELSVLIRGG
jgi:TetR/AcrR family transcriptional regulator, lmrAB and yxaGH operons repressor